jgi:putative phosphoesterase
MRLAVISDIHANEVAFRSVIKDIELHGTDQIVCLGDVTTLGPMPVSVLETLQDLNCNCILGNHDAFMIDPKSIHSYTNSPIIMDAVSWCRDQLSEKHLDFIRTFQNHVELSPDGSNRLLFFHGSPRSHTEDILSTTPADELDEMLAGHTATIMSFGHTHIQMLRQHKGTLIINPGSVGIPFKEFVINRTPAILEHAEYAFIEIQQENVDVRLRRIPFNKEDFRKTLEGCGEPIRTMYL